MKVETTKVFTSESGRIFFNELDCLRDENEHLRKTRTSHAVDISSEKEKYDNLRKKVIEATRNLEDVERKYKKALRILAGIPNRPGVYMYVNHADGDKKYIGSAFDMRGRTGYLYGNRGEDYAGKAISEAMRKYPVESWEVGVLEECPLDLLKEKETYYIELYDTTNPDKGYNLMLPTRDDSRFIEKKNGSSLRSKSASSNTVARTKNTILSIAEQLSMNVSDIASIMDKVDNELSRHEGNLVFLPVCVRNKTNTVTKNEVGIVPRSVSYLINSTNLHVQTTVRGDDSIGWSFLYSCSSESEVPPYGDGFATRKEAFEGLLENKIKKIAKVAANERENIDEATYNVLTTLTTTELLKISTLAWLGTRYEYTNKPKTGFDGIIEMTFDELYETYVIG